jgi:glutathione S-transferase
MPAIVDPDGPDGLPLSIFESGAILQYLGAKSGQFYPHDLRGKAEVDQWLFWQVGGLGPMAGQTHHFRQYAPAMIKDQRQIAYGVRRYTDETTVFTAFWTADWPTVTIWPVTIPSPTWRPGRGSCPSIRGRTSTTSRT